jgi:cytochrome d ubiquinol oxidase subunit I
VMVAMGVLMIGIALLALFFWWRKSLPRQKWLLWLLIAAPFMAEIAIQTGWASAELGRQPWIVYNLLKTVDAISKVVPAEQIAMTLAIFAVIYLVLFIGWARIFFGIIAKGPEEVPGAGAREPVPAPVGSATVAAASDVERR